MTAVNPHTWESTLLSMAHAARPALAAAAPVPHCDAQALARAYAVCDAVTVAHSQSFTLATRLLPAPTRRAIRALYAFCRTTDDIVDCCPPPQAAARLSAWRKQALAPHAGSDDPVLLAWTDTRLRCQIPHEYAEQFIDGVARDLRQSRYSTFADLTAYAYGVASTVGLMSMHVIGYSGAEAVRYAVRLGVALQLTNILRDVREDWLRDRLYLPLEDLAAFDLTEVDVAAGRLDDRWRAFMRFQIARNRTLYAEARPGIGCLAPAGRLAVAAASELYSAILDDIEGHDYDVFSRRAYVTRWNKLRCLPAIWRTSRSDRRMTHAAL